MSQNLDLGEFKETAIIKKLKKSKSNDNLKNIDTAKTETKEKRCRKQKYSTIEELFLNDVRYERFMDGVLSGDFSNDLHQF